MGNNFDNMATHLLAKIGQYAIITNNKHQVLILQRTRSKTWTLPGGRLNIDEGWKESLLREIKEECGLSSQEVKPLDVAILKDPYQVKYCVFFEADFSESDSVVLSPEHSGFEWVGLNKLSTINFEDEEIYKIVLRYLENHQ